MKVELPEGKLILEIERRPRVPVEGEMYTFGQPIKDDGTSNISRAGRYFSMTGVIISRIISPENYKAEMDLYIEAEVQRRVELELAAREFDAELAKTGESGYVVGSHDWSKA